jgi:elongation factor 1-beta
LSGAAIAGRLQQNTSARNVLSKGQISKMAQVVVTLRIMPSNVEVDLHALEGKVKHEIVKFCNSQEFRASVHPIAFGLKALQMIFVMEESKGSTEHLENEIAKIHGVQSVEVTDVRRAIG